MTERPLSVTIISWFLIIAGALSIVMTLVNMNNPQVRELMEKGPMPVSFQIALTIVVTVVNITCGVFMLKGANWARMLYLGLSAAGFVFSLVTSPMKLMVVPGVIVFAIIAFFLLRPRANAFFTGRTATVPPPLP